MRKVASNQLTASMLSGNFNEKVNAFIASDQALNCIKGTSAY